MVCRQWASGGLCPDCVARFALPAPRCPRCGLRHAGESVCGTCQRRPPAQHRTEVAVDYGFPWDGLVTQLKFAARPELAHALARLMTPERFGAAAAGPGLVLPVPLSPGRLRERGYNQAWELARRAARAHGLPARADLLRRWRDTPAQTTLDAAARRANLRGAFWLAPGAARALEGRTVILVDDVMTTGATVEEATRTVLSAGARSVTVWALARTPEPGP